jgi:hypothetical protein
LLKSIPGRISEENYTPSTAWLDNKGDERSE